MHRKSWIFGKVADPAKDGSITNRLSKQTDFARIGIGNGESRLYQGCFSRPVWAEQSKNRAWLSSETHVPKCIDSPTGPPSTIGFRKAYRFKCIVHVPLYRTAAVSSPDPYSLWLTVRR